MKCIQCPILRRRIRHLENLLKSKRKFPCCICGERFISTQGLASHHVFKHKRQKTACSDRQHPIEPAEEHASWRTPARSKGTQADPDTRSTCCCGSEGGGGGESFAAESLRKTRGTSNNRKPNCSPNLEGKSSLAKDTRGDSCTSTLNGDIRSDVDVTTTTQGEIDCTVDTDVKPVVGAANRRDQFRRRAGKEGESFLQLRLYCSSDNHRVHEAITECPVIDGKFHCTFCPESFFQKKHMRTHMSLVHEDGYFTCRYCQVHFNEISDLAWHVRMCERTRDKHTSKDSHNTTLRASDKRRETTPCSEVSQVQDKSSTKDSSNRNKPEKIAPLAQRRRSSGHLRSNSSNEGSGDGFVASNASHRAQVDDAVQQNEAFQGKLQAQRTTPPQLGGARPLCRLPKPSVKHNAFVLTDAQKMVTDDSAPRNNSVLCESTLESQAESAATRPHRRSRSNVCLNENVLSRSSWGDPKKRKVNTSPVNKDSTSSVSQTLVGSQGRPQPILQHSLHTSAASSAAEYILRHYGRPKATHTDPTRESSPSLKYGLQPMGNISKIDPGLIPFRERLPDVEETIASVEVKHEERQVVEDLMMPHGEDATSDVRIKRIPELFDADLDERSSNSSPSKRGSNPTRETSTRNHSKAIYVNPPIDQARLGVTSNISLQCLDRNNNQGHLTGKIAPSHQQSSTQLPDRVVSDLATIGQRPIKEEPLDEVAIDQQTTSSPVVPVPVKLFVAVQPVTPMRMLIVGNGSLERMSAVLNMFLELSRSRNPCLSPLEVKRAFVEDGDLRKTVQHATQWLQCSPPGPRGILLMPSLDIVEPREGDEPCVLVRQCVIYLIEACRKRQAEFIVCSVPTTAQSAEQTLQLACLKVNSMLRTITAEFGCSYYELDSPA